MANVPQYTVTLSTPKGGVDVQVPTFLGADAAGRRAHMAIVAAGYGDMDTVTVVSVTEGGFDAVPIDVTVSRLAARQ